MGGQVCASTQLRNLSLSVFARAFALALLPLENIVGIPEIAAPGVLHAGSWEGIRFSLHAAKQRAA